MFSLLTVALSDMLTASTALLTLLTVLTAFTVLPALMMALSTVWTVLTGVDCVHDAMVFVFVVMSTVCC